MCFGPGLSPRTKHSALLRCRSVKYTLDALSEVIIQKTRGQNHLLAKSGKAKIQFTHLLSLLAGSRFCAASLPATRCQAPALLLQASTRRQVNKCIKYVFE